MQLKIIISYGAGAGLLLGFVAWRLQTPPAAVPFVAILLDRSASMQESCASLAGAAERAIQSSPVELSVFITGDAHSGHAPVLMPTGPAPQGQRLIKGRGRQLVERQAFVRDLAARCGEQTSPLTSPIFLGIRDAVAHLRTAPGPGEHHLVLQVVSDLRENYEPHITAALVQRPGVKAKLPKIDNTGIDIRVCGYAQTQEQEPRGKRPPASERVIEVWRQLFSDPARVSFKPYCPPPTTSLEEQ